MTRAGQRSEAQRPHRLAHSIGFSNHPRPRPRPRGSFRLTVDEPSSPPTSGPLSSSARIIRPFLASHHLFVGNSRQGGIGSHPVALPDHLLQQRSLWGRFFTAKFARKFWRYAARCKIGTTIPRCKRRGATSGYADRDGPHFPKWLRSLRCNSAASSTFSSSAGRSMT